MVQRLEPLNVNPSSQLQWRSGKPRRRGELEVQTTSAALNLTDDAIAMCQEEADSDYDRDHGTDDVDDGHFSDSGFDKISDLVCDVYSFKSNQ